MQFSPQQDAALKAVSTWLKKPEKQIFRLFGYAGTGKTTLAQHIAEGVDGEVLFAAYTGKAAQVLRARGAEKARTIHSLIYRPRGEEAVEDETSGKTTVTPTFSLNRSSTVAQAALVIVDECSMVDEALGHDLLSFGTPILVLGDPGQLPPVKAGEGGAGFFTEAEPDILLTEVHRQARESPIIDLAMRAREGARIDYGSYGDSRVISKREVDQEIVLAADQVLVGRNRTRRLYNQRLRTLKGFEGALPQFGDRLVCLRNDPKKGLLNGSLWSVDSVGAPRGPGLQLLLSALDEGPSGPKAKVRVLKSAFEDPDTDPGWALKRRFDDFDFGYTLTVHKAQGSQWDDLVLFDESFAFSDNRARWLYTAITRAAEKITIVK
ncbi:ATP-dependent DNA helicase [Afifella pfennigii]|uniref:ATP-dependent DNA helicase n=1 Tax=Afifella pfennigii TaxID=209897 RepID=UPI00047D0917|nr:ATP-dependent RecD-like DNA helicase [Afifella pfennigii]